MSSPANGQVHVPPKRKEKVKMNAQELFKKYSHYPEFLIDEPVVSEENFIAALSEALEGGHLQPVVSQPGEAGSKGGPKNAEGLLPCPFCGSSAGLRPGELKPTLEEAIVSEKNVRCSKHTCAARFIVCSISEWNTRGGERF